MLYETQPYVAGSAPACHDTTDGYKYLQTKIPDKFLRDAIEKANEMVLMRIKKRIFHTCFNNEYSMLLTRKC